MSPAQDNTAGHIRGNWLAVIMLAIGSFSIINTEFLPIGLLSDIAQFYNITTGQAGLIVTVPGVTAAFAAPLLMMFSGRFDRKIILVSMIFLVVLSNLTIYTSDSFILSLVSRFFLGIAIGGFWSFSIPFGVSLVPQDKRSKATAIVTAGIAAGTVAGVPLGTFLGVTFGWKNAFLANGIFTLIIFLLQLMVLPGKKAETTINAKIMWNVLIQKAVSQRIICAILFGSAHFTA
ncbi:MFS transporter, partial [Pantoea sp.]|uniref:MFS transporter n=1 Tax=Pantoea sp. TaxID=69393 RepID=UPI0028A8B4FA